MLMGRGCFIEISSWETSLSQPMNLGGNRSRFWILESLAIWGSLIAQIRVLSNPLLKNIQIVKISALHSKGLHYLFKVVNETNIRAESSFTTSRLNKLLDEAISKINQPSKKGKSIKLRYINFGGKYPTTFIIHSNFSNSQIPNHLRRYLINFFYEKLDLKGIELSLLFKKGNNPFEGKKNKLTDRQIKKKKRLMKFAKKSKK